MKTNRIFAGLALAAGMILTQTVMAAGPLVVDLGSCSNFTILAGTTVTYPGSGIINGDVGLYPGPGSAMLIPPVKVAGTIYESDATGTAGTNVVPNSGVLLNTAKNDLTTAYNAAAGRTPVDVVNPGAAFGTGFNIGGLNLAPGLYKFGAGQTAYIYGSDLTLSGGPDDVWIFQCAVDLQMEPGVNRSVILAGGAQAKNVFWQVGTAAVLGTYSVFKGTIMAGTSITMDIGGTMEGRALAFAQVTFSGSSGSLPATNGNSQVITNFVPTNGSVFAGTNIVGLSAQASSSLPVTFTVKSGPSTLIGTITGNTNLVFANTGLVSIVASQAGNSSYFPATSVTNTYTIIPPLSAEPGGLAINVTPASGSWRLTAPAGYTGPTTGTGNLAAVSAVVGAYGIAYGALSGYMLPTNNNQSQVVVAGVTSLFAGVYRQISTIAPPVVTATEGTYTNMVMISWPSVSGATGYEIWKSQTNDINTAVFIIATPGLLYYDTDVVPLRSYYYWGLSKTATQVSPLGLVTMGYASLAPNPGTVADIAASDMVFLPVNATNLSTAGTVSFRLKNLGPYTLNSANVAFDFRIGNNNTNMVLLGSAQRAFNLVAGQEQLIILTAQEKHNLVVPATLSGVKPVQVTVRHASTLFDPNLANNTTTAAGMVLVRASGVNSPGRSVNDYDGDGKSDFALWQAGSYLWAICLSGPQYQSVISQQYAIGNWPVPGDYDGDGITDVAIYCQLNSWWNVLLSSTKQDKAVPFFGGLEFAAAQGDFDGDSMTDPAVYRASDGTLFVAASSQGYAISRAYLGGIGDQPVVADYDGDGLADPAVYNRATGLWNIAFSSLGYQVTSWTFGGPDYLPVSADYDGDGLVDPAVYAPGTAYLQVLLSGSLATKGVYTWQGGVIGSINGTPVPADYDGDGIADFAVYHKATGLWELFQSTHGYQEQSGYFGDPSYQPATELMSISLSNSRIF